jgi:hypothetical protein
MFIQIHVPRPYPSRRKHGRRAHRVQPDRALIERLRRGLFDGREDIDDWCRAGIRHEISETSH